MSRKTTLILLMGILVLGTLAAFVRPDRKNLVIKQVITGSIFTGIEVTTDPLAGITENRTLLNLYAKGSPGQAHIEVVGGALPAAEPSGLCPEGTDLELFFIDGGFVETFNDHSMLFYVIDETPDAQNALCVDFQGPNTGIFDYTIIGGAGRFKGATGHATVAIQSWNVTAELSGETGSLVGRVQLP